MADVCAQYSVNLATSRPLPRKSLTLSLLTIPLPRASGKHHSVSDCVDHVIPNLLGGASTEQLSTLLRVTTKRVNENICVEDKTSAGRKIFDPLNRHDYRFKPRPLHRFAFKLKRIQWKSAIILRPPGRTLISVAR